VAAAPTKLPTAKDLRDDAWWPVGDQEETGSCVGWAVADGLLRWHFTMSGQLQRGDELSVRYLWMAAKETDELTERPTSFIEPDGTSLKAALKIARGFGVVPAELLPFKGSGLYADDVETFYTLAARLRLASYHNLRLDPSVWQYWLATQGPVLIRLDCDDTWMNAKETGGELAEYHRATAQGGHAALLVGYTPSTFIVRNSWGATTWGHDGYAYASAAYAAAAFTEAYGVTL
jgi:hypothetical protein